MIAQLNLFTFGFLSVFHNKYKKEHSRAICYLERGAEADAELEEQEGDDRPHENGLRAPWLCCLRTPPIA